MFLLINLYFSGNAAYPPFAGFDELVKKAVAKKCLLLLVKGCRNSWVRCCNSKSKEKVT